ncbi:phosphate-starvation-inducible PsiE family protein [Leptolyngbya sp. 7M]|uniref:phosphate-starvation-inducible PsiE family protein n=1 Tax=Leptolyngbya sp. 7M TaxID=2812896 RepID=UPI001B8C7B48|nr:phosphate-starvation-inducible PsiE family protein [Leptolyngbya sp. 7M]QYO62356.1 phosphate-starvation-inducible PsiE family protein [Leptolyngbya sp. 7M]
MISPWEKLSKKVSKAGQDENFLGVAHWVENIAAKVLAVALSLVILISLTDLVILLVRDLMADPVGFFDKTLIDIFGLFLNILIALELLENITAYLKKHVVQVELVIVTSLIAIARKIIIFDFSKYNNLDLLALGGAILALSVSYLLIKRTNRNMKNERQ